MKLHHAALAAIILMASVVPAVPADFVYFAEQPMACTMETVSYPGQQFAVYAYLGEFNDVSGIALRIESDRFAPEHVQSVTPAPGVSIDSGNIFDGIVLSLDVRALDHEPLLLIEVSGHATHGYVWTRDVEVHRSGGDKALDDQITVAYNYDCLGSTPHWDLPDTVDAVVAEDDILAFRAGLATGSSPPDAEVRVVDNAGWVVGAEAYSVTASCDWCPWSWTAVEAPVFVPDGTANGTLNEITLEMRTFGSPLEQRTVVLRAVTAVTVETTTWSRIKALYR